MLYQKIVKFYYQLDFREELLPENVRVMNPYQQAGEEVERVMLTFHKKYFSDNRPRNLILGINPGRNGAGLTGIPFTDTPALKKNCKIETIINTRETSSEFIYKWIEAYGGPEKFYARWFIGGVCPLGFLTKNKRANWVNWNYYDSASLKKIATPFIVENLKRQIEFCKYPKTALVLGSGKNFLFMEEINQEYQFFEKLVPLEHPRFVMQYKRKSVSLYLEKFLSALKENEQ